MTSEDWKLLEALLDPIRAPDARRRSLQASRDAAEAEPAARVVALLRYHQIDQLWLSAVGGTAELSPPLAAALGRLRAEVVLSRFRREGQLRAVFDALRQIPCVIFKGEHLGRTLYADPLLRPCADTDLLVAPDTRDEAIRLLLGLGFRALPKVSNISHELALLRGPIGLDLHWEIFRPGRARIDLARWILAERSPGDGAAYPSPAATLVLLLVHGPITSHLTDRMIQTVDLDRWLRRNPAPWDEVCQILEAAGLRSAAWAMLHWTRLWHDTPVPEAALRALRPGPLRRAYLARWLRADPARLYPSHPSLVRIGFSLALQDRATDMARAIRAARVARQRAADELSRLRSVLEPDAA